MMADQATSDVAPATVQRASPYAYYALLLLTLANFFNYVDRSVVSIVGNRIKADLSLTDAQLGFLLGTAFAVFYGVIGIAMGRIADAVSRPRLMTLGLTVWSGMTAVAGFATSFGSLAAARMGVGIGEACANPCSHSLLSDYFPARNRSVVLGVYILGVYLGGAASLIVGGLLLQHWGALCRSFPNGACKVADWRAAFFVVGLPGLLLALLISTLREPSRPQRPKHAGLMSLIVGELSAAVPPFTLLNLHQVGGASAVIRNLLLATALILGAWGITRLVGDPLQWAAVALGVYSVTTWGGVLRKRDRPLFRLTFGCPTFLFSMGGGALLACISGAVAVWSAPYVMRNLGASPGVAGLYLGVTAATSSCLGVMIGSFVTDIWKRHDSRASIWICMVSLIAPIPALLMMLRARDLASYVSAFAVFTFLIMLWSGAIAALIQDFVLPRMRGSAAAAFSLVLILVGSGVGPYWVGKISAMTGSLANGFYSILGLVPIAAVLFLAAARRLPAETPQARRERAAAAGELI